MGVRKEQILGLRIFLSLFSCLSRVNAAAAHSRMGKTKRWGQKDDRSSEFFPLFPPLPPVEFVGWEEFLFVKFAGFARRFQRHAVTSPAVADRSEILAGEDLRPGASHPGTE